MNKSEFIYEISNCCSLTKNEAKEVYEKIVDIIKDKLTKGEEVVFHTVGKLTLTQTKPRKVYSVKKKQMVKVGAIKKVKFITSTTFKESIN